LMDRDGVINLQIADGYVRSWQDFSFLPGALEALRLLAVKGYAVILVSNQAGVGRGLMSHFDLHKITRRMRLEVALAGGNIESVYYCTHKREDSCDCRKPRPGLLLRAIAEHGLCPASTFMVGDSITDMEAAGGAGCHGILLQRDAFLFRRMPCELAKHVASNLLDAVQQIILHGPHAPDFTEISLVEQLQGQTT